MGEGGFFAGIGEEFALGACGCVGGRSGLKRARETSCAAPAAAPTPSVETSPPYDFSFETLLAQAKRLAAKPYTPQRSTVPAGLDKLSPEQYRSIRFNRDRKSTR